MHTFLCLLDTGSRRNLLNKSLISSEKNHCSCFEKMPKLRTATQQPLHMDGNKLLHVRFGALWIWVMLGTISNLAVGMFLGTSFIDYFIRGIFQFERNVVRRQSHPIAISVSPKPSKLSIPIAAAVNKPTLDTLNNDREVAKTPSPIRMGG